MNEMNGGENEDTSKQQSTNRSSMRCETTLVYIYIYIYIYVSLNFVVKTGRIYGVPFNSYIPFHTDKGGFYRSRSYVTLTHSEESQTH
jgi:hypothetical protein